jgi:hypothetical protein
VTVSNRYAQAKAELDREFPESWVAQEPGELIVGEYLGSDVGTTARGPAPLITLRLESGEERTVWCFHRVLENKLGRLKPRVGDTIAIRYLGEKKSAKGDVTYKDYDVSSDRGRDKIDWVSSFKDEDDAPDDGLAEGSDVPADLAGLGAPLKIDNAKPDDGIPF